MMKRKQNNQEDKESTPVQGLPKRRQPDECPYCGMIEPNALHCCSLDKIPSEIVKNIGTYLPTKDLGNFALTSKTNYYQFPELTPVRTTLKLNNYTGLKNKFAKNAFNEGNAARLLYVRDPSLKKWEELLENEKDNYRGNFSNKYSKKGDGPKEAGGTPDFIFRKRITDVFTVNVSDRALDKRRDALRAVQQGLLPKAVEKWNNYGVGTIAVADISDFPSDLSTQAVINAILEAKVSNERFRKKVDESEKQTSENKKLGLMLIRNLEFTEVFLESPPIGARA